MNFANAVVLWERQHWGRGVEMFMPSILKILDLLLSHTKIADTFVSQLLKIIRMPLLLTLTL